MRTQEQVLKILKEEHSNLKETFQIKRIGIFGSWVRGEQTEGSDIDVLVEFEKPVGFFAIIELEDHLNELLRVRVDFVTSDALKPLIKFYILEKTVYA